jgi:hypothetical protein
MWIGGKGLRHRKGDKLREEDRRLYGFLVVAQFLTASRLL